MDPKLRSLPPLKRLRLLQIEQECEQRRAESVIKSSQLPAKKRKEARGEYDNGENSGPTYLCLPAKKRVWAIGPDLLSGAGEKGNVDPLGKGSVFVHSDEKHGDRKVNKEKEDDVNGHYKDEEDDGIMCAVCQSTDGEPSDPIVFCDGCDLMVHASCYGDPLVKGIPEGDWFCRRCLASESFGNRDETFSCFLCTTNGGALKPTKDGRWAHIVCSLFVPEVYFEDPEGREGICCSEIPKRRWKETCYVCKIKRGCVIDCSEMNCQLAFHVTCGLKENLHIEYRERRKAGGGIVAGFCKEHTNLWERQQETGKFKIVAREAHRRK
ncbi:PREDICTED: protein Jade-1-like isoform X2 [Tarenaya hassleriana]|uniref:protein Jade-1-like isoform X2 n=1 Tax=Tarenaya hassleriana TaxID=28532 RepID=UPI00053C25AA|nr:PREDICTED: protein Jade-1-like isoform X2 [Tarenaya hassleriana]